MEPRFEYLLRLGDNTLVLGHRTSEWCGTAPTLEEDIALANTALDLIGQTQMWLGLAGAVEGAGRDADALAYHRDAWDFRNLLLVEQPNRDFGHTIMRQFLFDAFHVLLLGALETSKDDQIAGIAAKSRKEASYHLARSRETVIALGDGTMVSHAKMQAALDRLWPFAGEMCVADPLDDAMHLAGIGPDLNVLGETWDSDVRAVIAEAMLRVPDSTFAHSGGKSGTQHSEHLGHMLAVMQTLPRSYPDARW